MDFDFEQISDLLGSMSEEDLQNLQDTAQSLFSQFGGDDTQNAAGQTEAGSFGGDDGFSGTSGGTGFDFSPELLARLTQIMGRMNKRDPRTDLILALRPHLSRRRQHRAEQAAQMMKMLDLLPALQETMQNQ